MIQVETTAYTDPAKKVLQDWLRAPGCTAFLRYLAEQSAELTADAGNFMVRNEPGDKEDAESAAEAARSLQFMIKFIKLTQGNELPKDGEDAHSFEGIDLRPMPVLEVTDLTKT